MYSHGGLEMNSLFRLNVHPALGGNAVEDSKTSFENETESLYLTQLDSQNGLESAVAGPTMSSAWNTDLCGSMVVPQPPRAMMMVRPEDVTGQKPVPKPEPMDEDDANVMAMIEANFDLSTLMDTPPMAESTIIEETQETIDDMAQFLQTYEPSAIKQELAEEEPVAQPAQAALPSCLADELLSLEQRQTLDQMQSEEQILSEEDLKDAEMLLDSLLAYNSSPEEEDAVATQQSQDILKTAVDSEGLADSGFQTLLEEAQPSSSRYSVANVSHCVTPDGKQVIIVVQRPTEPAAPKKLAKKLMPRPSTDEDEDDRAWQPQQPQKRRPGRKREERVSLAAAASPQGVSKRSYKNIKDRKERKKIQNVEAARRYRDKKKQEQVEMEAEEAVQRSKNMRLRGQLKDIQSEVNTMKKLMKELGMLKSK